MGVEHSKKRKGGQQSRKDFKDGGASRRDRVDNAKRKRTERGEEGPAIWQDEFTEEEIKNEPRRKKRKVALVFGYAGTGYHGLQIERNNKTVEGDLYRACVRSGAISKANSDDPQKVGWVRCSRTDRNVHAAANVISAQLIVEDADIVEKINEHLPPQIRIWGIEVLNNSFNAYQRCEGRVYEYWIPTFSFIPPHPRSFLGQQLADLAQESGHAAEFAERQQEVSDFWTEAEEKFIAPVLKQFDAETGSEALSSIFDPRPKHNESEDAEVAEKTRVTGAEPKSNPSDPEDPSVAPTSSLEQATKALKEAYQAARRSYRIDAARIARVDACMQEFQGTHNFWNYTLKKDPGDPSAKRYLMRTSVGQPIEVRGTEWIPLDVYGQSFMLNQIRKMAFMAAMCVRCGSEPALIRQTYSQTTRFNMPKAPAAGLLLERPIFDAFNASLDRLPDRDERSRIDFEKFRPQIDRFKREHIIEPMHGEEEHDDQYYNFWMSLDSLRSNQLLYFSAAGVPATERKIDGDERLEHMLAEDGDGAEAQGDD